MKGKLSKFEDRWGVIYDIPNPPIATATVEWLPLDPNYVKYYSLDEDAEGGDVEFTFSEKWYELEGKTVVDKYARLKRPDEQTNAERFEEFMKTVEYPELEGTTNLCEDIIKGKGELRYKDGTPMRSYNSPKIQELLDEIEKESVPSYREISDEEIEEASRQINYGGGSMGWIKDAFKKGAAWYREELKKK